MHRSDRASARTLAPAPAGARHAVTPDSGFAGRGARPLTTTTSSQRFEPGCARGGKFAALLLAVVGGLLMAASPAWAGDLAFNRPASASSTEDDLAQYAPAQATDGNSGTRWSSAYADNQWWEVDLGSDRTIDRVELNWEVAYASRYRIRRALGVQHVVDGGERVDRLAGPEGAHVRGAQRPLCADPRRCARHAVGHLALGRAGVRQQHVRRDDDRHRRPRRRRRPDGQSRAQYLRMALAGVPVVDRCETSVDRGGWRGGFCDVLCPLDGRSTSRGRVLHGRRRRRVGSISRDADLRPLGRPVVYHLVTRRTVSAAPPGARGLLRERARRTGASYDRQGHAYTNPDSPAAA